MPRFACITEPLITELFAQKNIVEAISSDEINEFVHSEELLFFPKLKFVNLYDSRFYEERSIYFSHRSYYD